MSRLRDQSQLRDWLSRGDMPALRGYAQNNRRVLSFLTALTYDNDAHIAWGAVRGLGQAAAVIAAKDAEFVRIHLRRLMWLLNDESGGIAWRAPEAMAEIIATSPGAFDEFVPIVISILDMQAEDAERFKSGALWALGRLAYAFPEQVGARQAELAACLDAADAQKRGLAVWCLRRLDRFAVYECKSELQGDQGQVWLFDGERLLHTSVARIVRGEHDRV